MNTHFQEVQQNFAEVRNALYMGKQAMAAQDYETAERYLKAAELFMMDLNDSVRAHKEARS